MALTKQALNINFAQGLDTKTDRKQVAPGRFLALTNSVFTKAGMLQKRNGFGILRGLPASSARTLTTYNDNLIAVGTSLQLYSQDSAQWIDKGTIQPVDLSVIAAARRATSQTTCDVAVASNGLAVATWSDSDGSAYYQVVDSATGQIIVSAVALPASAACPRAFVLGRYLLVTYLVTVSATTHLQYVAIPVQNPTAPLAAADISTQAKSISAGYDGAVANNNLYLAVNGSDGGGAIRLTTLTSTLTQGSTTVVAGYNGDLISMNVSLTYSTPRICVSFYSNTSSDGYTAIYDQTYNVLVAPTQTITSLTVKALTGCEVDGEQKVIYQVQKNYGYAAIRSDYIGYTNMTMAGVVGTIGVIQRGVGLASKAFSLSSTGATYMLAAYGGALQPTFFLIDSSGNVVAKVAYENGGGYMATQVLPGVNVTADSVVQVGYLYKDLIASVSKAQGSTVDSGIYSQTGINVATFQLGGEAQIPAEIGNDLHLTGGILWMYDGVKPVEHSFSLYPEDVVVSTSATGGSIGASLYYYYATYEWTDAQGNIHRSAPSVPVAVTTTGSTSTNTVNIPTYRLTYKTGSNRVRICIYRWSTANQVPYLITSISSPILNDTTADSVTYVDTASDASIVGNLILYTNGGVVENIAAPAVKTATLYKSRLLVLYAEDRNTIGYSKQVIQATPVEMSDLFTIYVAPTTGSQGSTGDIECLSAMDDKAIFFKKNAIYYLVGTGPDNTGANNDFSDPVFVTSTVGCANQQSIVFLPQGLMFQSDKGIWLLGRDLSTTYIGAPVEAYNDARVVSAVNVPGTNQVRLSLDTGVTLVYDYFFGQWGTFKGVPLISDTIYGGKHTFLNKYGRVFQETPGSYLDGSVPVLMSFTTSWLNLAGVQGFERAYFFYMLGTYLSPHKLQISIAYDYNEGPTQVTMLTPDNYNAPWGGENSWGSGSPWGGASNIEQWRIFLQQQKCEAFQITIEELFDPTHGTVAGAGLTMSGLDVLIGIKGNSPRLRSNNSVG